MKYRIRNWLLRLLAGERQIMLNCHVHGIVIVDRDHGLFCGNLIEVPKETTF